MIQCDVSSDGSVKNTFNEIQNKWGKLDFFVHAVAFADKNELRGNMYKHQKKTF